VTLKPLIMVPQQQVPTTSLFYQALLKTMVSFVVKTRGQHTRRGGDALRLHQNAPGFALDNFKTMQDAVDQNTFSQRLGLYLVGSFAGLAVAMVFAGLYGVLSQLVSYRRREIGVRMALGATRVSVAQLVLRNKAQFWLEAALLLASFSPLQPGGSSRASSTRCSLWIWYLCAVVLALAIIGLTAALLPARKAASIEPMQALRED
jgi:putative ABC transport system permease protein